MLFKNLTSADKKRKVIASSEIADKKGVRTVIRRHFICIVREVSAVDKEAHKPAVYVLKQRDNKARCEKFFCRIKGSLYALSGEKIFRILFTHSLKINIFALSPEDSECGKS